MRIFTTEMESVEFHVNLEDIKMKMYLNLFVILFSLF